MLFGKPSDIHLVPSDNDDDQPSDTQASRAFSDMVLTTRVEESQVDSEPVRDPACGMYQGSLGMKAKAKNLIALQSTTTYKAVIGELIAKPGDQQAIGDMLEDLTGDRDKKTQFQYRKFQLEQFCKALSRSETGTTWVEYRLGRNANQGTRKYAKSGLQTLGARARNYFAEGEYLDADLVNCFPSLCYYIAKKILGETPPMLRQFVFDRDKFVMECDMKKTDMIAVLFSDKKPKLTPAQKNNTPLCRYIDEIHRLRESIYDLRDKDKTLDGEPCMGKQLWGKMGNRDINKRNPRGSFFFRQIELVEVQVMDRIKAFLHPSVIPRVDMHDGFLYDIDADLDYKAVNEMLAEEFHLCMQFRNKPIEAIDIEQVDQAQLDEVVVHMEKPEAVAAIQNGFQDGLFIFNNGEFGVQGRGDYGELVIQKCTTRSAQLLCQKFQIWDPEINRGNGGLVPAWKHFWDIRGRDFYNRVVWKPYRKGTVDPASTHFDVTGKPVKDLNSYTFPFHEWCTFEGTPEEKEDVIASLQYVKDELWANTCGCHQDEDLDDADRQEQQEQLAYLVTFFARKLLFPGEKPFMIPMLINAPGSGKDTSLDIMRKLLGSWLHNQIVDLKEICDGGGFNEKLDKCAMLVCNESSAGNSIKWNSQLKELCDRAEHEVNKKFQVKEFQKNVTMLVMCSNSTPVVEPNTRRNRVIQGGSRLKEDHGDPGIAQYSKDLFAKCRLDFNLRNMETNPATESLRVKNNIAVMAELIVAWAKEFAVERDEDGELLYSPDKQRVDGLLNPRDWTRSKAHRNCLQYCLPPMVKFCVALNEALDNQNSLSFVQTVHKNRKENQEPLRIFRQHSTKKNPIKKEDNVVVIKRADLGTIVRLWCEATGQATENSQEKRKWNHQMMENHLRECSIMGKQNYSFTRQRVNVPTCPDQDFNFHTPVNALEDRSNRYVVLHLRNIINQLELNKLAFTDEEDVDDTQSVADDTRGLSQEETLTREIEKLTRQRDLVRQRNDKRKRNQEDLDRTQQATTDVHDSDSDDDDTSNDAAFAKALAEGFN